MADEPVRPVPPEPRQPWSAPFLWTEYVMAWVVYAFSRCATLKVVIGTALLLLMAPLGMYVVEWPEREQSRQYLQWLVLTNAAERPGGGGVIRTILEDLHARGSQALEGLQLQDKTLRGIRLEGARLAGTDFSGSDLTNAKLAGCDLSNAIFDRGTLVAADLSAAVLRGTGFRGADLQRADLRHIDAVLADFSGANLHEARLEGATFRKTNLTAANLEGQRFSLTGLGDPTRTEFEGTELRLDPPVLRESDLSRARLARTNWTAAMLSGNTFTGADFSDANLQAATLIRVDLVEANLARADLTRAVLRGADLRRADLQRAKLIDAQFQNANLTDARLEGAIVGQLEWLEMLAELEQPPIRCDLLRQRWRVVETRNEFEQTEYVLEPRDAAPERPGG